MSDILSELVTRVQIQLIDDGTLFSTATVSAAIRQALRDFNTIAPIHAADLITTESGQKEYELTGGDFTSVLDILDVLRDDEGGDEHEPLDYDNYFEDNRPFIRLRETEASGDLLIRFTIPYTIQDLDNETASTLDAQQDQVIVDGACGHVCQIRSASLGESNVLNKQYLEGYKTAAKSFFAAFQFGAQRYADRNLAKSEKRTTSWVTDNIAYKTTSNIGSLEDL